jgi:hypothetical protein
MHAVRCGLAVRSGLPSDLAASDLAAFATQWDDEAKTLNPTNPLTITRITELHETNIFASAKAVLRMAKTEARHNAAAQAWEMYIGQESQERWLQKVDDAQPNDSCSAYAYITQIVRSMDTEMARTGRATWMPATSAPPTSAPSSRGAGGYGGGYGGCGGYGSGSGADGGGCIGDGGADDEDSYYGCIEPRDEGSDDSIELPVDSLPEALSQLRDDDDVDEPQTPGSWPSHADVLAMFDRHISFGTHGKLRSMQIRAWNALWQLLNDGHVRLNSYLHIEAVPRSGKTLLMLLIAFALPKLMAERDLLSPGPPLRSPLSSSSPLPPSSPSGTQLPNPPRHSAAAGGGRRCRRPIAVVVLNTQKGRTQTEQDFVNAGEDSYFHKLGFDGLSERELRERVLIISLEKSAQSRLYKLTHPQSRVEVVVLSIQILTQMKGRPRRKAPRRKASEDRKSEVYVRNSEIYAQVYQYLVGEAAVWLLDEIEHGYYGSKDKAHVRIREDLALALVLGLTGTPWALMPRQLKPSTYREVGGGQEFPKGLVLQYTYGDGVASKEILPIELHTFNLKVSFRLGEAEVVEEPIANVLKWMPRSKRLSYGVPFLSELLANIFVNFVYEREKQGKFEVRARPCSLLCAACT